MKIKRTYQPSFFDLWRSIRLPPVPLGGDVSVRYVLHDSHCQFIYLGTGGLGSRPRRFRWNHRAEILRLHFDAHLAHQFHWHLVWHWGLPIGMAVLAVCLFRHCVGTLCCGGRFEACCSGPRRLRTAGHESHTVVASDIYRSIFSDATGTQQCLQWYCEPLPDAFCGSDDLCREPAALHGRFHLHEMHLSRRWGSHYQKQLWFFPLCHSCPGHHLLRKEGGDRWARHHPGAESWREPGMRFRHLRPPRCVARVVRCGLGALRYAVAGCAGELMGSKEPRFGKEANDYKDSKKDYERFITVSRIFHLASVAFDGCETFQDHHLEQSPVPLVWITLNFLLVRWTFQQVVSVSDIFWLDRSSSTQEGPSDLVRRDASWHVRQRWWWGPCELRYLRHVALSLKARNGPGEGPSRSDWPRPHRVLQAIGQWHKAARGHEELGWLEKDGKSAKSSGSIDVMLKVRWWRTVVTCWKSDGV